MELMVEGDFDVKAHPFLLGLVQPSAAASQDDGIPIITKGCYDITMNGGSNITWLMNGFEKFGYRFIGQSSFVIASNTSSVKICVTMHKDVDVSKGRKSLLS